MTQKDLSEFGVDSPDNDDKDEGGDIPRIVQGMRTAPDDAEPFNDLSCPWCLCPPERFEKNEETGVVGCGHCDAMIPIDAEWYLNGEKVCI